MTDSSDCESDAGASPSVSSDDSADSSASSRSSSPSALKIVLDDVQRQHSTPKKRENGAIPLGVGGNASTSGGRCGNASSSSSVRGDMNASTPSGGNASSSSSGRGSGNANTPVRGGGNARTPVGVGNASTSVRGGNPSTPVGGGNVSTVATPGTPLSISSFSSSSSSSSSTPITEGKKSLRRRQISLSVTPVNTGIVTPSSTKPSQNDSDNKTPTSASSTSTADAAQRKRKRPAPCTEHSSPQQSDPEHNGEDDSKLSSPEKKRKRNKRRRTRSERNLLAGKTTTSPTVTQVVTEGEEAVALDAEIDRVLEEKAIKNNLSATNVKSIIRHVITNNLVQKMVMSAMKKRAEAGAGGEAGGSSDEDGLLEPKMTRAKTKELMGNKKISLWPIVDSPVKMSKKPVSETHILIHNDLPEDSSGDEEYVPKETDISEIAHSDDESGSVTSCHNSDVGSPAKSYKLGVSTRRSMQADRSPLTDSVFKTPPPRPTKSLKKQADSAISLRTRSKLPLNDTPLEDLERQLVAPDITKDMYDWGTETDNEDYLDFLKDFLNPGKHQNDVNELDDDADPEYNVMEDDEDLHDREELRMDRAVKVPKKELTQLIAELFEPGGMLSGDDMDDHDYDLATLTGITPLVNDSAYTDSGGRLGDTSLNTTANDIQNSTVDTSVLNLTDSQLPTPPPQTPVQNQETNYVTQTQMIINEVNETLKIEQDPSQVSVLNVKKEDPSVTDSSELPPPTDTDDPPDVVHAAPYFRDCDLEFLKHQIRQHLQLLTQSYVLTVSSEDNWSKIIAKSAKTMVVELNNLKRLNGPTSYFGVCNLESAWTLVNFWPHKYINQSPIKKKILEEKYISESGIAVNNDGNPNNYFPRHVVKVISENVAFLYNSLLPECYHQKNVSTRCRFTYQEDCLLLHGIDSVVPQTMGAAGLAEIISQILLVNHPSNQVYHRIRNLRKSSPVLYCRPNIKQYFTSGVLPEPDRTVPQLTEDDMLPPIHRDRRGLSSQWRALLLHIEDSSRDQWEERLSKDPFTKFMGRIWNAKPPSKKKENATPFSSSATSSTPRFTHSETINRVFPNGALIVDTPDPNFRSIPILGANGKVGAIITIPRLAMCHPPEFPQPREGEEAEKGELKPTEPQQLRHSQTDIKLSKECVKDLIQEKPHSTVNILGLNHLTRRAFKTPIKQNPHNPVSEPCLTPDFKLPLPPSVPVTAACTSSAVTTNTYNIVEVVGKPFDLPELAVADTQVIDFSTLQTPVKNKIFEKVAEQEQELQQIGRTSPVLTESRHLREEIVEEDDAEYEVPESPYVILEGTEVELTEDDEEDVNDTDYRCQEQPKIVTLSSDEEMEDAKPTTAPVSDNGGTGGGGTSSTSTKKTDNGGGNASKQGTSSSSSPGMQAISSSQSPKKSSLSRTGGASGGKGDDSDEDGDRRLNTGSAKKRPLPKDNSEEEDHQDKDTQNRLQLAIMPAPPPPPLSPNVHHSPQVQHLAPPQPSPSHLPSTASTSTPSSSNNRQQQKKARRSPGGPTGGKSRVTSKYNVTPPEKMLEDDPTEFDDVADAYMDSYLVRVQAATEANHPGIYPSFVQMLMEAGEGSKVNQGELYVKVKALFKDYPCLLREFESFLDPTLEKSSQETMTSAANEETMAVINLMQMLDKYTESCPTLKVKIMNKLKSLKEKSNLNDRDMATALEPFFAGNPVMMEAFRGILSTVYRPQSLSSAMDFEVLELDMEDPLPQQQKSGVESSANYNNCDDLHFEVVKLPDETQVPATSTCPCICHIKTSDPAFSSRSKHCRKCSLKFQDGKIFYHNGKVMRPVSVELTPAPTPSKHAATSSSTSTRSTPPAPPQAGHHHEHRVRKDSHHQHHLPLTSHHSHHHQPTTKSKEHKKEPSPVELGGTKASTSTEKKTCGPPQPLSQNQTLSSLPNSSKASSSTVSSTDEVTEKCKEAAAEASPNAKQALSHPTQQQTLNQENADEDDEDEDDFTEEEDRIILTICQQEASMQMVWRKMSSQIPHRTLDQLKRRRAELIELIKSVSADELQ